MPDPLPSGATRCRHHDRQSGPCPGHVTWTRHGNRLLGRCQLCGRDWADLPRDHLGQPIATPQEDPA